MEKSLKQYRDVLSAEAIIEFDEISTNQSLLKDFSSSLEEEYPNAFETLEQKDNDTFLFSSKSSKLVLSKNRLNIVVPQFFGNYQRDYELCHAYLAKKTTSVFKAIQQVFSKKIRFLASIVVLKNSFEGLEKGPILFLNEKFLKEFSLKKDVEDLSLRWGFKEGDRYFVNIELNTYRTRSYSGEDSPPIPAHKFQVTDFGLKFKIDVNTKQEAFHCLPDYSIEDLENFLSKLQEAITRVFPELIGEES